MRKYIEEKCSIYLTDGKEYLIENRLSEIAKEIKCNSFLKLYQKIKFNNQDQLRDRIIDRTEICKVDQSKLPQDAVFKRYESLFVQEILIKTDNVEYKKSEFPRKSSIRSENTKAVENNFY
jgi:hypothetical protein